MDLAWGRPRKGLGKTFLGLGEAPEKALGLGLGEGSGKAVGLA